MYYSSIMVSCILILPLIISVVMDFLGIRHDTDDDSKDEDKE